MNQGKTKQQIFPSKKWKTLEYKIYEKIFISKYKKGNIFQKIVNEIDLINCFLIFPKQWIHLCINVYH